MQNNNILFVLVVDNFRIKHCTKEGMQCLVITKHNEYEDLDMN